MKMENTQPYHRRKKGCVAWSCGYTIARAPHCEDTRKVNPDLINFVVFHSARAMATLTFSATFYFYFFNYVKRIIVGWV
jgi:hypothetical protein